MLLIPLHHPVEHRVKIHQLMLTFEGVYEQIITTVSLTWPKFWMMCRTDQHRLTGKVNSTHSIKWICLKYGAKQLKRDHIPTHVPFFRTHVAACMGILQVSTAGACKQWSPVVSSQTTRQLMRCYRYLIPLEVKQFLLALETDKNIDLSWKIIPPKEKKRGKKEKQHLSYIWNKYHIKKYRKQSTVL